MFVTSRGWCGISHDLHCVPYSAGHDRIKRVERPRMLSLGDTRPLKMYNLITFIDYALRFKLLWLIIQCWGPLSTFRMSLFTFTHPAFRCFSWILLFNLIHSWRLIRWRWLAKVWIFSCFISPFRSSSLLTFTVTPHGESGSQFFNPTCDAAETRHRAAVNPRCLSDC